MTKSIEEKLFSKTVKVLGEVINYANLRAPTLEPDSREYDEDWDVHLKMVENLNLLKEAQSLLSEPEDPNPEYDRGICELLAVQLGLPLSNTPLEECGAFKVGVLLGCSTIDNWYKPLHHHSIKDLSHEFAKVMVHGSAFCSEADWAVDETTDDKAKLTCEVCRSKYGVPK
jgi:hypothetical protein